MDIKIDLPKDVELILNKLNEHGTGLVVGGAIRDSLLGLEPKDWDFATNINYDRLLKLFKDHSPKEIGKSFGIIQIKISGVEYEIAKFRTDGNYSDNRKPDSVEFVDNFYEDAKRRDFTINAMGYDGEKLHDFFNGREDLKGKTIRFIGRPEDRIKEDYLRMLRAVRFVSRFDGFKLHPYTYDEIWYMSPKISEISKERISSEINKILISDKPSKGFDILQDTGLLRRIIPELDRCCGFDQNNSHHDKDLFEHILDTLDNTQPILVNRISALLHDIGKMTTHSMDEEGESHYYLHHKVSADMSEDILKRLKYDNKTVETVKRLIYDHMNKSQKQSDKAIKRFMNRVGIENLPNMFDLLEADIMGHKPPHNFESLENLKEKCHTILENKEPMIKNDLNINGKDLIDLGFKQGTIIGDTLDKCMELVLAYPKMNTRDGLIKYSKLMLK